MRLHVFINTKAFGNINDDVHAEVISQTDSHQVTGFFNADTDRGRAVIFIGIVSRAPEMSGAIFDNKRRIKNQRCRRKAVNQRGEVNKRFERRTRLAFSLCRAVKFRDAVFPAALHRQYTARMRVHRHNRALHFGDLLQLVIRFVLQP